LPRLLLVRHGVTAFNDARKFMGHSDLAMSEIGYRQVERLRDRLVGQKIDAVYSSDLKRTLDTAEIILAGRKVEIVPCPELRECYYGDCEGLTFQEISSNYPDVAEKCINFTLELEFPEGESFRDFIERASGFLDRLENHARSDTILITSHNGPLKVLVLRLLGIDMNHWWQIRIDTASLSIVETYPRGAILNVLNDTSHLAGINK
jgi:alpha-ribazole phosphatase